MNLTQCSKKNVCVKFECLFSLVIQRLIFFVYVHVISVRNIYHQNRTLSVFRLIK